MRRKRISAWMCFVLCISSIALAGCGQEEAETVYEDLKVATQLPAVESIVNYGEFMGNIEAGDTVTIVAKASGEVLNTYFEEGDIVNEGDLLFDIDSTQAKQGIASAQAAYQSTKSSVDKMLGSGLDSQALSITNTYKNAEIGLDTAKYNYSNTCERIGDTKRSISDMEGTLDGLRKQNEELNKKLQAAIAVSANSAAVTQLKEQISAISAQISSVNSGIVSMTSTRDQLESSIHTYENTVKQAEVGMDIAEATLNMTVTRILNESLETAATTLNQAQVAVDNARAALDNYHIKSPVSGKVESVNIDQYGMAQAGSPAYVITTDDTKKVIFYISESNISDAGIGQQVMLTYADTEYPASITSIDDSVDAATGLFKVEAMLMEDSSALHTGSSVKVRIETGRSDNALTVPLESVYYEDEQAYVYLNENGTAKKVYVQTGLYDSEKIQITEGINADSVVITSWSARLKDGEKVNGVN